MSDQSKFFTGTAVSRHLAPGERSWAQVVTQSGKPITDADLNLSQDILQYVQRLLANRQVPSGWLKGQSRRDSYDDFTFYASTDPSFTANAFHMAKRTALVAGFPVVVEYTATNTAGDNKIQLETPPIINGSPPDVKRTDFVFLEVWQALVSDSANASGTLEVVDYSLLNAGVDTVTVGAITFTAVAAAPGVNEFLIGADNATTAANLASAINTYSTQVSASAGGTSTVTVVATVSGTAGNALALASSDVTAITVSGATLSGGVDEPNKPTQDKIYRHGNVLSSSTVARDDDIADPVIGSETTKRVQVQYRIRVTGQSEAVNFKTESDGFSNANVLAQGAQSSAVAGYRFVKADGSSTAGSSDASAYGEIDPGLWIAGDGTSAAAAALGTVDGFVYAVPICFVFRRNDASTGTSANGWDPLNNTNGALPYNHGGFANPLVGAIPAGKSDRPDGAFADAINSNDILDLRKHVVLTGQDLSAELSYQMASLLDGNFATWAIDTADKQDLGGGSGDVSCRFLVCNEIGRDSGHGGTGTAGDTTRGVTVRNFDHLARRFGDQPVVERAVFEFIPSYDQATYPGKYVIQANAGYAGWAEDDVLHLDLVNLNATTMGDYDPTQPGEPSSTGSIIDYAPPGTVITDVLNIIHDDGHYTTPVDQAGVAKSIRGLGTGHVEIALDRNASVVNGGMSGAANYEMVSSGAADTGSPRRILIEVEVTYPLGSGVTDTPDFELSPDSTVWPRGPVLENDTTQRPSDWEDLPAARFREGYREVSLEYIANSPGSGVGSNTPISDQFVSSTVSTLYTLRRIYGSASKTIGVTELGDGSGQVHDVSNALTEYGSSTRKLVLDTSGASASKQPLSAAQTRCAVTYFAQDAIPNYGASAGYQVSVYWRSVAPQTVGVQAGTVPLPDPLTLEPLAMSKDLWSGTVGKGSVDLPYPYVAPLDQIPVNDGSPSSGTFQGEWYFAATAKISIDDFDAETGLLNLHSMVPLDPSSSMTFNTVAKDAEFRAHYKLSDANTYRPTAFAQGLSGIARHKVFMPFLARATADTAMWRKNEVLLVVLSRFAELDDENTIRFVDTAADNRTCAAVYRTRNLLLMVGE